MPATDYGLPSQAEFMRMLDAYERAAARYDRDSSEANEAALDRARHALRDAWSDALASRASPPTQAGALRPCSCGRTAEEGCAKERDRLRALAAPSAPTAPAQAAEPDPEAATAGGFAVPRDWSLEPPACTCSALAASRLPPLTMNDGTDHLVTVELPPRDPVTVRVAAPSAPTAEAPPCPKCSDPACHYMAHGYCKTYGYAPAPSSRDA